MRLTNIKYYTLLLVAAVFLNGCASQVTSKEKTAVLKLNATDQQLISQLYLSNLLNIKLAEEAETRSTSAEAKQLAEIVLSDNKIVGTKLHEIAGKNATELPMDITPEQLKTWQHIVKEKGLAFDKKFTTVMLGDYAQVISLCKKIQTEAANKDLKRLADTYKDYTSAHKEQAVALEHSLNNRRSRPLDTTVVSDTLTKN
jgi:predicted outer membrane protein